jgi:hypothetical protein
MKKKLPPHQSFSLFFLGGGGVRRISTDNAKDLSPKGIVTPSECREYAYDDALSNKIYAIQGVPKKCTTTFPPHISNRFIHVVYSMGNLLQ